MKIVKLYTDKNDESQFIEIEIGIETQQPLGNYSQLYPAAGITFREFEKNAQFDWHNAPQPQYIIYLEGEVEIEISKGEKRTFKAGDVLFATDLTGKGHITRTLTAAKSIIITMTDIQAI